MKEFVRDLLGNYFKPVLTVIIVLNIFGFIYWVMWADLTEASKRFGDVILGVLLSKLGTAVDYWLGTTDREEKQTNIEDNEKK